MAIKWGSTYVTVVKWGSTTCTQVKWGNTVVWPDSEGYNGSSFSWPISNGFTELTKSVTLSAAGTDSYNWYPSSNNTDIDFSKYNTIVIIVDYVNGLSGSRYYHAYFDRGMAKKGSTTEYFGCSASGYNGSAPCTSTITLTSTNYTKKITSGKLVLFFNFNCDIGMGQPNTASCTIRSIKFYS